MFCNNCGEPLTGNAGVCTKCGAPCGKPVRQPRPQPQSRPQPQVRPQPQQQSRPQFQSGPQPPKRSLVPLLIILTSLLLSASVIMMGYLWYIDDDDSGDSNVAAEKTESVESSKESQDIVTAQQGEDIIAGTDKKAEESEKKAEEKKDVKALAMQEYNKILDQAGSYNYYHNTPDTTPLGTFDYALVQLTPNDPVPTLLLGENIKMHSRYDAERYIRVFQYIPENGEMNAPEESLAEVWYRLTLMADGNGLNYFELGEYDTKEYRITLGDQTLVKDTVWEGDSEFPLGNSTGIDYNEIPWKNSSDRSEFDAYQTKSQESKEEPQSQEPEQAEVPDEPLTDGNRQVLQGTVKFCSHSEIESLQGKPDPNGGGSDRIYKIIQLDNPCDVTALTVDMEHKTAEAWCIGIEFAGLESYEGQHITFSIDADQTDWPSDTSLPLGQPATRDVHVLK